MIFRTQDEIRRKLNKMEPPEVKIEMDTYIPESAFDNLEINVILNCHKAFESGYKQAIKEMKEYFNIKGNGIHRRYEE